MTYIYGLIDPRTQELRYIGKANDITKRLYNHFGSLGAETNHKSNWLRLLKGLGIKPDVFVIEEIDESKWQESEIFWIRYYKFIGCNLVNGNEGGVGGLRPTQEVRNKMRKSMTGKKRHPGFGAAVSKGKIGKTPNRVYVSDPVRQYAMVEAARTPEVRARLSAIAKKRTQTNEWRKWFSENNPAKNPEARKKMSLARVGKTGTFKGKRHTVESRAKISAARKGKAPWNKGRTLGAAEQVIKEIRA